MRVHGAHHQIVSALRGIRQIKIPGKWPATRDVVAGPAHFMFQSIVVLAQRRPTSPGKASN
jgi:hypothetical protein